MSPDCPAVPEPGPTLVTAMSLPTERKPRESRSLRAALFLRTAFLARAAVVRRAPFFGAIFPRLAGFFLRRTIFLRALFARIVFFFRFCFFLVMRRVYHPPAVRTIERAVFRRVVSMGR